MINLNVTNIFLNNWITNNITLITFQFTKSLCNHFFNVPVFIYSCQLREKFEIKQRRHLEWIFGGFWRFVENFGSLKEFFWSFWRFVENFGSLASLSIDIITLMSLNCAALLSWNLSKIFLGIRLHCLLETLLYICLELLLHC